MSIDFHSMEQIEISLKAKHNQLIKKSTRVIICATQRCGSTLVCNDFLNNELGKPEELFLGLVNSNQITQPFQLLENVFHKGTNQQNIFGVKLMSSYSQKINDFLVNLGYGKNSQSFWGGIADYFNGAIWVYIQRESTLRQAVSRFMSQQTGINHALSSSSNQFKPGNSMVGYDHNYNQKVKYDSDSISTHIINIAKENFQWEKFFEENNISPLKINYENIIKNLSYIAKIREIASLSYTEPINQRNLVKLANEKSEQIIQKFMGDGAVDSNSKINRSINQNKSKLDYFMPPSNTPVTDYYIVQANNYLPGDPIQANVSYQKKVSALNALADLPQERLSHIGLKAASPPSNVHSVSGDKAKLGDFYCPDMIIDCLQRHDVAIIAGDQVLDFGCSSGRVIRILHSFLPDARWYGCDPRESSINWASENFPGIHFFCSQEKPPLDNFADSTVAGAYAISVWSHFSELLALRWFDEMARIIRPGGFLIFTTHGYRSLTHFAEVKKSMSREKADERLLSLQTGQYHFHQYPDNLPGMEDLNTSDWGIAFAETAWYEQHLSKHWKILEYMPGRLMANQDVYLLRRR